MIGGWPVAGTMSATTGDQVTPGSTITVPEGASLGNGVVEINGRPISTLTGTVANRDGNVYIDPSRLPINTPEVGDVVIGQVTRLNENVAEIRVLHIESKEGGHRDLPALTLSLIHI